MNILQATAKNTGERHSVAEEVTLELRPGERRGVTGG